MFSKVNMILQFDKRCKNVEQPGSLHSNNASSFSDSCASHTDCFIGLGETVKKPCSLTSFTNMDLDPER